MASQKTDGGPAGIAWSAWAWIGLAAILMSACLPTISSTPAASTHERPRAATLFHCFPFLLNYIQSPTDGFRRSSRWDHAFIHGGLRCLFFMSLVVPGVVFLPVMLLYAMIFILSANPASRSSWRKNPLGSTR